MNSFLLHILLLLQPHFHCSNLLRGVLLIKGSETMLLFGQKLGKCSTSELHQQLCKTFIKHIGQYSLQLSSSFPQLQAFYLPQKSLSKTSHSHSFSRLRGLIWVTFLLTAIQGRQAQCFPAIKGFKNYSFSTSKAVTHTFLSALEPREVFNIKSMGFCHREDTAGEPRVPG